MGRWDFYGFWTLGYESSCRDSDSCCMFSSILRTLEARESFHLNDGVFLLSYSPCPTYISSLPSDTTAANALLATVFLLPQPRLQCPDVGALHLRLDPRLLYHPRLYNQHFCEFYVDGFLRMDGFW